jgi:hypothetical protein
METPTTQEEFDNFIYSLLDPFKDRPMRSFLDEKIRHEVEVYLKNLFRECFPLTYNKIAIEVKINMIYKSIDIKFVDAEKSLNLFSSECYYIYQSDKLWSLLKV